MRKNKNNNIIHQLGIITLFQIMYSFKHLEINEDLYKLTVLPRRNAAPAPTVAPIESATKPMGRPKR